MFDVSGLGRSSSSAEPPTPIAPPVIKPINVFRGPEDYTERAEATLGKGVSPAPPQGDSGELTWCYRVKRYANKTVHTMLQCNCKPVNVIAAAQAAAPASPPLPNFMQPTKASMARDQATRDAHSPARYDADAQAHFQQFDSTSFFQMAARQKRARSQQDEQQRHKARGQPVDEGHMHRDRKELSWQDAAALPVPKPSGYAAGLIHPKAGSTRELPMYDDITKEPGHHITTTPSFRRADGKIHISDIDREAYHLWFDYPPERKKKPTFAEDRRVRDYHDYIGDGDNTQNLQRCRVELHSNPKTPVTTNEPAGMDGHTKYTFVSDGPGLPWYEHDIGVCPPWGAPGSPELAHGGTKPFECGDPERYIQFLVPPSPNAGNVCWKYSEISPSDYADRVGIMPSKCHKAFSADISNVMSSEMEVKKQLGMLPSRTHHDADCFLVNSDYSFEFAPGQSSPNVVPDELGCADSKSPDDYYVYHGLADVAKSSAQVFKIYALGRLFNTFEQLQSSSDKAFRSEYNTIDVLGQSDTYLSYDDLAWQRHAMQQMDEVQPDLVILDPAFESNHNTWTQNQSDFVAEVFRFQLTRGSSCVLLDAKYTNRWKLPLMKQIIGEENAITRESVRLAEMDSDVAVMTDSKHLYFGLRRFFMLQDECHDYPRSIDDVYEEPFARDVLATCFSELTEDKRAHNAYPNHMEEESVSEQPTLDGILTFEDEAKISNDQ